MAFSATELNDLPNVISAPRFATYLQAKGNHKADALSLYEWNLELSAAFIVPLQVCEVAARNGVVEVLEKVHGQNWPWSNGFIRSLPVPKRHWHYNPQTDLRNVAGRMPTTGKVVAELKFAFWGKTFTKGQDARLWIPHMNTAFRVYLLEYRFRHHAQMPSQHCRPCVSCVIALRTTSQYSRAT